MMQKGAPPVRVLVTGFGPFPGVFENASLSVAGALAAADSVPGVEHFAAVLPVAWDETREAARAMIAEVKPHAVLHFGVSKRVSGFEIETRAVNASGSKPDQAGVMRASKPLIPSAKRALGATLPPHLLLGALRRTGFPAQLSRDAGRYLCNALFYWSLADAEGGGPLVSFIHIPAIGMNGATAPRLTLDGAVAGGHVLIRAAAQAVLLARRSGSGNRQGRNGNGSQALYGNGRRSGRIVWRQRR